MAFGKAVFAETFDLFKAPFGEIPLVTPRRHALNHFGPEGMDRARVAEGSHGTAQLVRLRRRETGRDNGDAHGLFLKQRNAQGLAQNILQILGREFHPLLAGPAAQIGVDHVALDGTGADDGDLDHQVIEIARAQARQHGHLGPAFHLKDPDGIAPAQHVVDRLVLRRDRRQVVAFAMVLGDQIKALADTGQHAQGQQVDLQHPQRIQIVLVPFDHRAVRHGRVGDRHHFRERPPGDDEAAHVLRKMAGKAGQFPRQVDGHGHGGIVRVQADFPHLVAFHLFAAPAPDIAGQGADRIQ